MSKKSKLQKNSVCPHKRLQWLIFLLLLAIPFTACSSQPDSANPTAVTLSTTPPQAEDEDRIATEAISDAVDEAAEADTPVDDGFDRVGMIKNILTNVVLPLHETFEADALLLKDALAAFDADPTAETLATAQQAWRDASDAWAGCQLFSTQESVLIQNQISKWPVNVEFVEKFIGAEDQLNALFVASIGSSSKGLPAIEYLLFDLKNQNERVLDTFTDGATGPRRRAFLVALGDHLHEMSIDAKTFWALTPNDEGKLSVIGQLMADAEQDGNAIPLLQIVMNGVSEQLEDILNMNLRGVVNAELGMPIAVEAPYSNYSLSHIAHYIEAFELVYTGGLNDEALGLDDYLRFLQIDYDAELMSSHIQTPTPDDVGKPLADIIHTRIDQVLAELEKVDEPLANSIVESPQTVTDAYEAALRLLILVRVDMVNNFGVTLTFNDGD